MYTILLFLAEFMEERFYLLDDLPFFLFLLQVAQKIQQLDVITQKLSKQVMEHHEEMGTYSSSLLMESEIFGD
jgi:hypothetical protein